MLFGRDVGEKGGTQGKLGWITKTALTGLKGVVCGKKKRKARGETRLKKTGRKEHNIATSPLVKREGCGRKAGLGERYYGSPSRHIKAKKGAWCRACSRKR